MNTRVPAFLSIAASLVMFLAICAPTFAQGGRGGGAAAGPDGAGRGQVAPAPGPIPRRADGKPDLTGN